ncbi:hypothetical protein N7466_003846 [Penicillium verhagenii]|uniref:uncharacterized protein n=1 Tax=Penicillium verhagenii TaxID=1562060 RepID=UPI0025455647|nr:uncharacterized protein N7466_003846 [Penicillium verhagenii]KAJ5934299.1 hypothetical protein N7466_003846 [Penicillium verhagenii]
MFSCSLARTAALRAAPLLARPNSRCLLRRIATGTQAADTRKLPLAGVRVLDMSRVLAGQRSSKLNTPSEVTIPVPGAHPLQLIRTVELAMVKVHITFRYVSSQSVSSEQQNSEQPTELRQVNRNKKSLGLSFAHPEGVEILHQLARDCDVVVENYLPGSLKKYNLDYESLRQINPRLIYTSITGYGQTGPYSNRPGFDVMVEAEFGLMHLTGTRDGPPVKVGVAVTDLTTGLYACNSIMAALIARATNGEGQHLDVCLSDCQVATLANMGESVLISGKKDSGRWGTAHPSVVPYQAFKTSDTDIFVGGANDRLFGILCDKLGKPEWKTDSRFATNSDRVNNREDLEPLIEGELMKETTGVWQNRFEGSGLPFAVVNDIQGTMNHEHVIARGMVQSIDHPACGSIKVISPPVKYSNAEPSIRSPPPLLGEHTEELLKDIGLDTVRIEELKKKGVVA